MTCYFQIRTIGMLKFSSKIKFTKLLIEVLIWGQGNKFNKLFSCEV